MNAFLTRLAQVGPHQAAEEFHRWHVVGGLSSPFRPAILELREGTARLHFIANERIATERGAGPIALSSLCAMADISARMVTEATLADGAKATVQGMAIEYFAPARCELHVLAEANLAGDSPTIKIEMTDARDQVVCRATLALVIASA